MKPILCFSIFAFLFCLCLNLSGQEVEITESSQSIANTTSFSGFIRACGYYNLKNTTGSPALSSGFSDAGLKIVSTDNILYKAVGDIRFRYGSEFQKQVSRLELKEAYIDIFNKKWNFSVGQKVLKWGRADFTNPTSKFNPQNLLSRSPDREDMDMGNLLASIDYFPSGLIRFQAVISPYYRPSILTIEPVKLPDNASIEQLPVILTNSGYFSYGFRSDLHLNGIDLGVSWFDGYDPMPGISLSSFSLDLSGSTPAAYTKLAEKPYKNRIVGFDFESSAGSVGFRGEAAWSKPYQSYKSYEFVPMEELKWVAGIDYTPGNWQITGEYSGKYIPGFIKPVSASFIGTEPDYSQIGLMMSVPGFNIVDYVRSQVGTFNRLYNYQLNKFNHTGAIRIESDLYYGKIIPSLYSMYNFTSKDLLVIPEIRYKPSDGITIVAGAEIYSGRKGSIFDIIDDFMNTIYLSVKVSF